jgi:peroxiredoxin
MENKMSLTPSTMIDLGTKAPDFNLLDTISGKHLSLLNVTSPIATVVMFICNHCPFVQHIFPKLLATIPAYQQKGISFVAISSNDAITYPNDGPDKMREEAEQKHFTFPYLYDASQDIAKAYQAACTPDFYIFDGALRCIYRGRFDASTPRNDIPVTGDDLCHALNAVLAGSPLDQDQKASLGCNIKWKE